MLDIIVTHYNEAFEIGKKFFDMLGCQKGIDFSDFRVLLVHDGVKKFPEKYFANYPYKVTQYEIPHGGVSAARNYGLDMARDKWIQFCDFDDMYSNPYALRGILSHMENDNIDFMWTRFLAEYLNKGDLVVKEENKENAVFVHGKYFRREWLLENGLRFPEGIHYSEDSAFCAIVNEVARIGRRGEIKTLFPAYIWSVRRDSVSNNPANEKRNLTGFIDRNFYVVEEFIRRGIPHTMMVGRMYADAYYAFHRADKQFPDEEERFIKEAQQYAEEVPKVPKDDMQMIMKAASSEFIHRPMNYSEDFEAWFHRITGLRMPWDQTGN